MTIHFSPLPTGQVRALQHGAKDTYGNLPEQRVSDGDGNSCRHCLTNIPEGEAFIVVAYRPFHSLQAYAETGPIFLCAKPCEPATAKTTLPEILDEADYIIRGYDADERIIYGTGAVTDTKRIPLAAQRLFDANDAVAFVHVRSARNNCYQCRIDRDQSSKSH